MKNLVQRFILWLWNGKSNGTFTEGRIAPQICDAAKKGGLSAALCSGMPGSGPGGMTAALGIVLALPPPQLIEKPNSHFAVQASEPRNAGESMSPDRDIRWHPRKSSKTGAFLIA
jgi:hypothetical protein